MQRTAALSGRGAPETRGFRTIVAVPEHAPYHRFIPAPGHGLGFNDLKVIECHELLRAIAGQPARVIDFVVGLRIELPIDAPARSDAERRGLSADAGQPSGSAMRRITELHLARFIQCAKGPAATAW